MLHNSSLVLSSALIANIFTICNAIKPATPPDTGYADGYYGNLPTPPTGDYLLATRCYCERAAPLLETDPDYGSYLQYEYYNYHMNKTLFFHMTCPQNHHDPITCFGTTMSSRIDPFYTLASQHDDWLCRLWGADKTKNREFHTGEWATLCFRFALYWDYDTKMKFNGQMRDIGYYGKQGREEMEREEEKRVCDGLCKEMLDMPRRTDETEVRSQQLHYTHLDDMCPSCA